MTSFKKKSFSCINCAIEQIVANIIAKGRCSFATISNDTFWKRTPRGEEIARFFGEMTHHEKIEFIGLFDIFFVRYHNGINAFISMTADPSSRNFEHTVRISISKGYKQFTERCSGRATPLGDLRSSIGSTPVQRDGFSTSPAGFQGSSVESDFQQRFSTFGPFQGFGAGPAIQPVSPFQEFASGFSRFNTQQPSFGGQTDLFTSQANFIPVQPTNEPINRKGTIFAIKKGRVCCVEIQSDCSSGPSSSSTVGIAKSPKEKTPVSTTVANLEKKIALLESGNPIEGSLSRLDLQVARAKLKKIQNSL